VIFLDTHTETNRLGATAEGCAWHSGVGRGEDGGGVSKEGGAKQVMEKLVRGQRRIVWGGRSLVSNGVSIGLATFICRIRWEDDGALS
jgi:hypothetical protein